MRNLYVLARVSEVLDHPVHIHIQGVRKIGRNTSGNDSGYKKMEKTI